MLTDLAIAAASTVCGFAAGIIYTGHRIPHLLAKLDATQARHVAHLAGQIRRGRNG